MISAMWNAVRFRESPWSYSLAFVAVSVLLEMLSAVGGSFWLSILAHATAAAASCFVTIELVYGRFPLILRGGQVAVVAGSFAAAVWIVGSSGRFSLEEVAILAAVLLLPASLLGIERMLRQTMLFKYTSGAGQRISYPWSLKEMFSLTFLMAVLLACLSGLIRDATVYPIVTLIVLPLIGFLLPSLLVLRGMLHRPGYRMAASCFGLAGLTFWGVVTGADFSPRYAIPIIVISMLLMLVCGWRLRHVGWAIQPRELSAGEDHAESKPLVARA